MKLTPFHDPNDYEAGVRHGLPSVQVITFNGTMAPNTGSFAGMPRFAARTAVLGELKVHWGLKLIMA